MYPAPLGRLGSRNNENISAIDLHLQSGASFPSAQGLLDDGNVFPPARSARRDCSNRLLSHIVLRGTIGGGFREAMDKVTIGGLYVNADGRRRLFGEISAAVMAK